MPETNRMKPVIVLPTGKMSEDDIQRLNDNLFCVVECEEPESVRFMEPPPTGYERCELAAIELSRIMLGAKASRSPSELAQLYVKLLLEGTKLEPIKPVTPAKKAK